MKRYWIILPVLLLITFQTFGQATFTGSAPKYVKPGERFEVKYVANERISEIQLPENSEVSFIGGPYTSTFRSTNNINGKVESTTEYTYTYLARIDKAGAFTIPPVKAKIKRDWVASNSLTIEVLATGEQGSGSSLPQLYFQLIPNKRTAYIGEPIRVDVKLFTKVNITNITGFNEPVFDGFYKEQLETEPLRSLEQEKVGNEVYNTGVITSYLLIPQKSGVLTINSATLQVTKPKSRSRGNDPFGAFFDSQFSAQRVNLNSDQVNIKVKELPTPKPKGYTGAVGEYSWQVSSKGNNITTNDAVSLQFLIKGTGNLKLLGDLEPDYPAVFSGLEPQIKQTVKATNYGYSGTKSFTYTLIPQSAGSFIIPEQKFVYFNPVKKAYVTLRSEKTAINVAKGEEEEGITVISGVAKEDVQYIGKEIHFIKTNAPNFLSATDFLYGKKYIFLFYLICSLVILALVVFRIVTKKGRSNLTAYKNKKANELAKKRLKSARKLLSTDNTEAFYSALSKALWGYLSDKLSIPLSEFTMEKAMDKLTELEVSAEIIDHLKHVSTNCEMARYAPSQVAGKLEDTYNETRNCIISLEEKLR